MSRVSVETPIVTALVENPDGWLPGWGAVRVRVGGDVTGTIEVEFERGRQHPDNPALSASTLEYLVASIWPGYGDLINGSVSGVREAGFGFVDVSAPGGAA